MISQRGYSGTSMEDIIAQAGITRGGGLKTRYL
jgi:AcrR family transcriptional regulator